MTQRYRIGISGSGFGVKSHLPALLAHPRFEVLALASPNSAAAIAKERNLPNAFTSCAEMVAGVELDAVVVASPPFAHRADVLASLDRGLHVLCEKPFALNLEEAEDMLAASKRAGTACALSHEFRWIPERTAVKELIVNGHLAPLRNIEITYLTTFLNAKGTRKRDWWFEKRCGGGMAGAIGSHMVDLASWLAGRAPLGAKGFIRTANPQRQDAQGSFTTDVDDGMFAVIDYGDGLVARVCVDGTCAVDQVSIAAHAENRTAVASGTSLVDAHLFSIDADETNELQCKPSDHARFSSLGGNVPYLMDLYDAWVRKIEGGDGSDLPSFAEALATQRVLDAVGFRTP
jgi:predicted dehydrogenase